MSRSTLSNLRLALRGMTSAGHDDYTVAGVSYWSNDELDRVLDRYRVDVIREQLGKIDKIIAGGSVEYYEYQSNYRNFESTSGGTAIFVVETGTGTDVAGTAYSVDYDRGRVTFNSDTAGTTYYLTGRSYNMNASAADVWRQKAAHYATAYDFSTDNHSMKRSQLMTQCREMADYYDGLGGAQITVMHRSDINA